MNRTSFMQTLLLMIAVVSSASAQLYQVDTRPARGFMPTADQVTSPLDSIDPVSGKLHLRIPLGSLPRGRAGFGFDVDLVYDSHLYDIVSSVGDPIFPEMNYRNIEELTPLSLTGGWWTYNFRNYFLEYEEQAGLCEFGALTKKWRVRVTLPHGSMHVMHLKDFSAWEPMTSYTGDGFFELRPDGTKAPCTGLHGWRHSDLCRRVDVLFG